MKKDAYQKVTETIIALLEQGVVPWQRPWVVDGYVPWNAPRNFLSGTAYSGVNSVLLGAVMLRQGYTQPFFVTYRQAQQLGGHVRKGESGYVVVFWKWVKGQDETDEERGYPVLKSYTVFHVSQCEEVEVPAFDPEPPRPTGFNPIEAAQALVEGMPEPPRIRHGYVQRAFYKASGDLVNMPERESFTSAAAYYTTLFHELGHSTGHATRLDRDLTGVFGTPTYAREELIAEMAAAMLCGVAGIQATIEHSAAYIQSWLKALQNDKHMVIWASSRAQRAVSYIRNHTSEDALVA